MNHRFAVVFALGFSSGLPLALLSTTLQAWFSNAGLSIFATGLLSLLGLPYLVRMIWAPLLDRVTVLPLGRRRGAIVSMQVLLLLGFNALSVLTPSGFPVLMACLACLLAFCSATQDLAIDAHRIEYLPLASHGLGASWATLGYRFAVLVAGGLTLMMAEQWGWASAYRWTSWFMVIGVLAIVWSSEPKVPLNAVSPDSGWSFIEPFKNLFARPQIVPLLFFIFFYKTGEAFTTTTSGIVMPFLIQYMAFSLDTIAYVNKIIGGIAMVLGGFLSGYLLIRWSLYQALWVFGLLQAVTNAWFILLTKTSHPLLIFILAVVSDNFSAGLASTALVVLLMRLCHHPFTATQFSILVAFSTIPRIVSGPCGAVLQSWFGWTGLYQIAFLLSFGFIPFLRTIGRFQMTAD